MKKADLSMNTIVIAVLALIVLVVLAFVFRDQISNATKGFTFVGDDAKAGIAGVKCETLLGDKICSSNMNRAGYEKNGAEPLPKPCKKKTDGKCTGGYGWIDCSGECYLISDLKKTKG